MYTAKKFSVQNSKIGGTRAASTFGDSIHQFKVEVTNSNMPPLLDYQTSTLAFRNPTRIKPPNLDAARVPPILELVYHHLRSFKKPHLDEQNSLNAKFTHTNV